MSKNNSTLEAKEKFSIDTKIFIVIFGLILMYAGIINILHINNLPTIHLVEVAKSVLVVIGLEILVGIAPLLLPSIKNKFWLVVALGLISCLIDSYVVIMAFSYLTIRGSSKYVMQYKVYATISAIIGGAIFWWGELYLIARYMYNAATNLTAGLEMAPLILVFLVILGYLGSRCPVKIGESSLSTANNSGVSEENQKSKARNILEFACGITILVVLHDPLFFIGILLVYSVVSGQAEDAIGSVRAHMNIKIILLLLASITLYCLIPQSLTEDMSKPAIFAAASVQSILAAGILPGIGDMNWEILLFGGGAMLSPVSSLAGLLIFSTIKEIVFYIRTAFSVVVLWFALGIPYVIFLENLGALKENIDTAIFTANIIKSILEVAIGF